jgi:hypothetical protein
MKTVIVGLTVVAVLVFQACRSTGTPSAGETPVTVSETGEAGMVTIRAWVDGIDKANRTVTLKGPRGGTVTLDVKDEKKLDAMAVGDAVVAAYVEALALQIKRMPGGTAGVTVKEARMTSGSGETPSAAVGREVVVTTTITAVDRKAQTVTITGPKGNKETIKVKNSAALQGVEAGDLAELTYSQALAVTLERAGL